MIPRETILYQRQHDIGVNKYIWMKKTHTLKKVIYDPEGTNVKDKTKIRTSLFLRNLYVDSIESPVPLFSF